jgi:hypothetical protein
MLDKEMLDREMLDKEKETRKRGNYKKTLILLVKKGKQPSFNFDNKGKQLL